MTALGCFWLHWNSSSVENKKTTSPLSNAERRKICVKSRADILDKDVRQFTYKRYKQGLLDVSIGCNGWSDTFWAIDFATLHMRNCAKTLEKFTCENCMGKNFFSFCLRQDRHIHGEKNPSITIELFLRLLQEITFLLSFSLSVLFCMRASVRIFTHFIIACVGFWFSACAVEETASQQSLIWERQRASAQTRARQRETKNE